MIRLISFIRVFNIASNEEDARKYLLGEGFSVLTRKDGPNSDCHYVDIKTFDAILAKKRDEIYKDIDRKQRELASLTDHADTLRKEFRDKNIGENNDKY